MKRSSSLVSFVPLSVGRFLTLPRPNFQPNSLYRMVATGATHGGSRSHLDDYARDSEQGYDQGQQEYDKWDRDQQHDDRDRDPPNTRSHSNRPGYDHRDDYRDERDTYRDDDKYRDDERGDYRDDDQYYDDRPSTGAVARRPDFVRRSTPDFSKHRSSSIAEIASGMSERREIARCAGTLRSLRR